MVMELPTTAHEQGQRPCQWSMRYATPHCTYSFVLDISLV